MKKKIATILTVTLLGLTLAGCGEKKDNADATPAPAAEAEETENTDEQSASSDDTVYEISLADSYANDHIFAQAMDKMAEELNEKSKGRLNVVTYHNSTMGSERDQVDAVSAGTLTMCIAGGGQIGNLYAPILVFDAPYCIRDNEHLQAVVKSETGQKIWDGLAEATSIRSLGGLYAGQRFITTSKVPVYTPDDLKGLKIRVPDQPLSIANFSAFGANPTPMAFSEVYLALQQNVVDGQENPLTQIMSAKFYEVQKYISTTAHVTQVVFLTINEDFYNELPEDLRQLLTETAARYCETASEESVAFEQDTLKELGDYGMTVCEPDKEAFKALAEGVIAEHSSEWGEGLYEEIQEIQ